MRYIGGKSLLLSDIEAVIKTLAPEAKTIIDAFSGSGAVAAYLKKQGYKVICNDFMYFSYVVLRAYAQLNRPPPFAQLGINDPIDYLNNLDIDDTNIPIESCFVYQNYAPHDGCDRMYFQPQNAIKIDIIRQTIEQWKASDRITDDEYYYLLAALIEAVPYISNITGVYAAYLKYWDSRSYKPLTLKAPTLTSSRRKSIAYNLPVQELLSICKADVLYSDSPYNSREYLPNYHVLETIARYDNPKIKGITGIRDYSNQKSDFCSKEKVHDAFEQMIRTADVKYIVISYSTEGLISTNELSAICRQYAVDGTFGLKEIPYRRYKSRVSDTTNVVKEQLYYFEKRPTQKSPLNYIGGKYKLLPQLLPLFPTNINTMVDLFCGGCDVSINVPAKTIYANDINPYVIDIYKAFQTMDIDTLLQTIDDTILRCGLTKTDKDAYIRFREHYNRTKDPLDLYVLVCFSFNYQFRFNNDHDYNNAFGRDRSGFNDTIRTNLIAFHRSIQSIQFTSMDFADFDISHLSNGDFLYADPPYLITTGSYNDGKRGFEGWSAADDQRLFDLLDKIDAQGAKFALSNVIEHKGVQNTALLDWSRKYNIHHIESSYNNSSYHGKNTALPTDEVLITNY